MNPILVNLLTFLSGLLIGHWFAIHRDRRKEINDLTDKFVLRWSTQAGNPSPYHQVITDDFYLLRRHVIWWQRKKYDDACDAYEAATSEPNLIEKPGKVWEYEDSELVAKATRNVMKFMRRR